MRNERESVFDGSIRPRRFYAPSSRDSRSRRTVRWWLIQQDIVDGKADVNTLQDSASSGFNHHRETAHGRIHRRCGKNRSGSARGAKGDVIKPRPIHRLPSIKNECYGGLWQSWKECRGAAGSAAPASAPRSSPRSRLHPFLTKGGSSRLQVQPCRGRPLDCITVVLQKGTGR